MFTGIIESVGRVRETRTAGANRIFLIESDLTGELKVDQSVAHNGVCLTVEEIRPNEGCYQVTAIPETLSKTALGSWESGSRVNLERSLRAQDRVDGHFVQGHVDDTGTIRDMRPLKGSLEIDIAYPQGNQDLIVARGSICLNGISLTIARENAGDLFFTVCIIPYTIEHTNIPDWRVGDRVNLEFDVLGKYVRRIMSLRD